MRTVLAILAAALFFGAVQAQESLRLEFTPPTTRVDGTPLDPATELDTYTVYCRAQASDAAWPDSGYTFPAQEPAGEHETTYETLLGERGRYECAMTVTDTDGRESDRSESVEFAWLSQPEAPTSVIIVTE